MKNSIKLTFALTLLIIISSCSSIKVIDSWHSETAYSIKDNNVLVIARTQNKQARIAFEQEMANQMRANGIKAIESFSKFPNLLPDEKLSKEKLEDFKTFIGNEGYNGMLVTVVKDERENTKSSTDEGFSSESNALPNYYPSYYKGFYNYYSHPLSYSTYGVYVPSSFTTTKIKSFIVETVIYDLDQPEEKQLVAVVTSQIEDSQNIIKNAQEHSKKVVKNLNKK